MNMPSLAGDAFCSVAGESCMPPSNISSSATASPSYVVDEQCGTENVQATRSRPQKPTPNDSSNDQLNSQLHSSQLSSPALEENSYSDGAPSSVSISRPITPKLTSFTSSSVLMAAAAMITAAGPHEQTDEDLGFLFKLNS